MVNLRLESALYLQRRNSSRGKRKDCCVMLRRDHRIAGGTWWHYACGDHNMFSPLPVSSSLLLVLPCVIRVWQASSNDVKLEEVCEQVFVCLYVCTRCSRKSCWGHPHLAHDDTRKPMGAIKLIKLLLARRSGRLVSRTMSRMFACWWDLAPLSLLLSLSIDESQGCIRL